MGVLLASGWGFSIPPAGSAQTQPSTPSAGVRPIGTIKAIENNTITLTTDSGPELQVLVQDSTRLLRIEPGQKDLKGATPVQLQDLQDGDRILVRGAASGGNAVTATAVILMKRAAIEQKQQQEQEDWQRRGVAGLVKTVDPAGGTLTISTSGTGGVKSMTVHVSKETVLRRYAPDSVRFNDAKPGPLVQMKPGDELRARGNRTADGSELAAEEIVSGSFRNIAGIISSVDQNTNEIMVVNPATKKPVRVKITADSELRKLPPPMAQMIAMRLKGPPAQVPGRSSGGRQAAPRPASGEHPAGERSGGATVAGPNGETSHSGAPPDLQQLLSRLPPAKLADLQKGDAVMIVSTQGNGSGEVNAITLLAGVEPILTASPGATQALMLSPWSLSSAGAEAAANP